MNWCLINPPRALSQASEKQILNTSCKVFKQKLWETKPLLEKWLHITVSISQTLRNTLTNRSKWNMWHEPISLSLAQALMMRAEAGISLYVWKRSKFEPAHHTGLSWEVNKPILECSLTRATVKWTAQWVKGQVLGIIPWGSLRVI